MQKPFLLCANWKMHKSPEEARSYFKEIENLFSAKDQRHLIFFPPFVDLFILSEEHPTVLFGWGAQNCHFEEKGAWTGEISPKMLKQIGVQYCLVGHSERRKYFNETDEDIQKKTKALVKQSIKPIICVGETKQEKQKGESLKVVERQLLSLLQKGSFFSSEIIIAYEPVWAIGSGESAKLDAILEQRDNIKNICDKQNLALCFLYGGSVNKDNVKNLSQALEIQGFLVGGACLDPKMFFKLYQNIKAHRE